MTEYHSVVPKVDHLALRLVVLKDDKTEQQKVEHSALHSDNTKVDHLDYSLVGHSALHWEYMRDPRLARHWEVQSELRLSNTCERTTNKMSQGSRKDR
jgi:hypothetical protein